jgi:hypothetical protein
VSETRVLRRVSEPKTEEVAEVGEDCIMRSFITSRFTKYYSGNEISQDEMGGACSTRGREKNGYNNLAGNPEEKIRL